MGKTSLLNTEVSKSIIAGILAMLLWGLIPILFKSGVSEANPSTVLMVRFIFSLLISFPAILKIATNKTFLKAPLQLFKISASLVMVYYCFGSALREINASA